MDTQVDQIDARLAEIQTTLDNDVEVQSAQIAHAAAELHLREARKALKVAEEAVQSQRVKIDLNQSALYGGRGRNPKELQDLQNESAALARHLSVLEDSQLEAMMALEDAEQQFASASAVLQKTQADFATRSAALIGERSRLQKDRERLLAEREPTASPCPRRSSSWPTSPVLALSAAHCRAASTRKTCTW